jgi:predicted alpha-1,2-mannosidase
MRRSVLLLAIASACHPVDGVDDPAGDTDTDVDPRKVPFTYDEVPLTGFVDPFVGTGGSGNVAAGALVPHGMVRLGPDGLGENGRVTAYRWGDTRMEGFTHTNLQGPGGSANGYSQVLVLPQTGALELDRAARAVPFDRAQQVAHPGRYAVALDNGVDVELTATGHAGVHRYAFPAGEARLIVDLGHSLGSSEDGAITLDGATIEGHGDYVVHPIAGLVTEGEGTTARSTVYVHAEASVPPTAVGTFVGRSPVAQDGATTASGAWTGGWIGWTFTEPTTVELRVGISTISEAQAARNLDEEVGDRGFDDVAQAADAAWNHLLNRVVIDADDDAKTRFYTALYHAAMNPADHTEAGGAFQTGSSGFHVVRQADDWRFYTDDWCLWDTFRTTHPLGTILEPERRSDILTSMLVPHEEGGWLDKCSWQATGYSRVMIGNHEVPVFADAYAKGFRGFDTELAWEAVDKVGTQEIDPLPDGACGYVNLGTPPDYLALGYVPDECDPGQSASMTLEHSYDDWTAARFAEALGRTDDAARYDERGAYWKNLWDAETGFVRPRNRAGGWRTPFDPAQWGDFVGFTEATSWIYTWFVPQDVPGLIDAVGGDDAFVAKLDAFFDGGRFDVSNEPSFHVPYLYAHAGQPWKTQARLRDIVATRFSTADDGLPGNDDSGATSAWLVFTMLGFYPVTPGDPTYTLSVPLVRRAELRLHPGFTDGGSFVIEVEGDPATQPYVAGVTIDGEPITTPFLTHARIAQGGRMVVTLGSEAGAWGGR